VVATKRTKAVVDRRRKAAGASRKAGARHGTAGRDPARSETRPARNREPSLDGAVDAVRRLLSELLEGALESVAGDLADLRREAAAGADRERLLGLIDDLLERTGAVRFSAEALDVVDPLIHAVVEERSAAGVPRGVIVEAVRPGFRSGRGLVLCKAAVAVSGG
jgi:hypothetical protein